MIIDAKRRGLRFHLREIRQYRELLFLLAYRDFRVKYAQTLLGLAWAVFNPLINLVILSFVFHRIARTPTEGVPAGLYTLAGLVAWTYFAEVFGQAGDSILANQNMVKKVYFPRLVLPLSKAITALIDLVVVLILCGVWMILYGHQPGQGLLFLPLFILLALMCGLTGGIWMSALTVRYRDFRFITPVLLRAGMFITPIAYPASAVPEPYRLPYFLNPLAGTVEGFKWCLTNSAPPPPEAVYGFILLAVALLGGILYFSRVEARIADIV